MADKPVKVSAVEIEQALSDALNSGND
jgi:hypothetical protein